MERERRLPVLEVGAGVGAERVRPEQAAVAQHALVDEPPHGRERETGLVEPALAAAARVVADRAGSAVGAPELVAAGPEQDGRVLRHLAVRGDPRLQVRDADPVVHVGLRLVPNVDDDRRQDEVARRQLVGAELVDVEVARHAVMRAGVLALLHVLEVEAVVRHRERGVQREPRIAGEAGDRRRIVHVAQEHDLTEPGQRRVGSCTGPAARRRRPGGVRGRRDDDDDRDPCEHSAHAGSPFTSRRSRPDPIRERRAWPRSPRGTCAHAAGSAEAHR